MKILIGCEYSGKVREAFRKLGHDAWSCDLIPADDSQEFHYQMDIEDAMYLDEWDLIIMHPPCTALCVSGNRWYGKGMPKNDERIKAVDWTVKLWNKAKKRAKMVCMENPVGVLPNLLICRPQYIQPWQFGHGETKKTGLWLHNLPELKPTNIVEGRDDRIHKLPPSDDRWKIRSETYQGIADAMAEQWGCL